ncbi:MAG TPA: ribonuclease Y [Syntrophorhabdaceae bacterium]|jgi:ribonuclease Y|nr:ribonuclease Y [Syntrophorhabdaceae bacterium]HOF58386.1 ribonuclease Y [Syntrophorhabdaceae bacterium]HOS06196.1 ribonuclease Y [Syntrophorhabdaceae bacterium]HPL41713.1 ribonuclease Y [Syntrophorhabdaceae bacterium]HQM76833.1 ribonuclease Y [Syntrophorhabdaceae bacterium]
MFLNIIITIITSIIALFVGFTLARFVQRKKIGEYEKIGKKILEDAKKEADVLVREASIQAKDVTIQAKNELEQEIKTRRIELQNLEKRLSQKESNLDKKIDFIDKKEDELTKKEKDLTNKQSNLDNKIKEHENILVKQREKLEKISGMSSEDAKKLLMQLMEDEAKYEAIKICKKIEEEAKEKADKKAKEIIALSIQRYAGDYVGEDTVSAVTLPNEEMKGRIIGREGRNIRALEAATGVDIIIDDTPEAVILSCFNPIRREVARISIEKLISDGRIHPARIEEIVSKVAEEMEDKIKEAGEQAVFDLGVHNVHPELVKILGRLKFRSSYAQNVYQHSLEVAFICGIIASELRMNVKEAKRAGLLHDIGKAVDHEIEGSHASIGADLARKYGESEHIIHSIAAHHEDVPTTSILDVIVQAADALSGARPGARREMLETYVKRLEELERIANSFPGVDKSYAIQAGREIRIAVSSDKISDEQTYIISRDIAKKIETELSYPGQIKIVVIRETRAVEYAK